MTRRQGTVHPFKKLGLVPTDRTLRVLEVIATWGGRELGPSNREIAELAGIRDEGQMSKLLTRLEGVGLIQVTHRGHHIPGQPYAWSLTAKGKKVQRAIEAQRDG